MFLIRGIDQSKGRFSGYNEIGRAKDDKIGATWTGRIHVDRGQSSDSYRNPCNFGSYRLKVEMHLNTRSKTIGRESFCARHNHRDFFTISWNIWAICLRDERRPAGCLTARFILFFFFPFLPRRRIYAIARLLLPNFFIATTAKITNISGINEFSTCGMNYGQPSWFTPTS